MTGTKSTQELLLDAISREKDNQNERYGEYGSLAEAFWIIDMFTERLDALRKVLIKDIAKEEEKLTLAFSGNEDSTLSINSALIHSSAVNCAEVAVKLSAAATRAAGIFNPTTAGDPLPGTVFTADREAMQEAMQEKPVAPQQEIDAASVAEAREKAFKTMRGA